MESNVVEKRLVLVVCSFRNMYRKRCNKGPCFDRNILAINSSRAWVN